MKEVLDCAIELAKKAGAITLKHYGTVLEVEDKADMSPVTVADRAAEEFLRAEIERRFPDDGIVGEEHGVKEGRSGRRWIVDPIDGTKTFIRGVPLYGTLIAVEVDEEPVVGVIHCPPLDETVSALVGHGAFHDGVRCHVSPCATLAEATMVTTATDSWLRYLGDRTLIDVIRATRLQRTWGDCYGYMLLATGRVDVMIDPRVARWDVAPMLPIIREAGGVITGVDGRTDAGMTDVVAGNAELHRAAMAILRG